MAAIGSPMWFSLPSWIAQNGQPNPPNGQPNPPPPWMTQNDQTQSNGSQQGPLSPADMQRFQLLMGHLGSYNGLSPGLQSLLNQQNLPSYLPGVVKNAIKSGPSYQEGQVRAPYQFYGAPGAIGPDRTLDLQRGIWDAMGWKNYGYPSSM